MFTYRRNKKGMTLIEIIATVIIVAIGLVGIMRLAPDMLRTKEAIERRTQMAFLGIGVMEDVKVKAIINFSRNYSTALPIYLGAPYEMYWYTISDTVASNVKTIRVTIGEGTTDNPKSTYVLDTMIAQREQETESERQFYSEWYNQPTEKFSASVADGSGFGGGPAIEVADIDHYRDSYQITHDYIPEWSTEPNYYEKITFDIYIDHLAGSYPGGQQEAPPDNIEAINPSATGMKIKDNDGNASNVYMMDSYEDLGDGWYRVMLKPTDSTYLPMSHDDPGINLHVGTKGADMKQKFYIDNIKYYPAE